MINIHDKQSIGKSTHILDSTDTTLKFFHGPRAHQGFFLGQFLEGAVTHLGFQIAQTLDRGSYSLVIRQHAAQPAVINVGHTC